MTSITKVPYSLKQVATSERYAVLKRWTGNSIFRQRNILRDVERRQAAHSTAAESCVSYAENENTQERKPDLKRFRDVAKNGPSLKDFISGENAPVDFVNATSVPYLANIDGSNQKVYFDVYGCQMNVNDTEVIWSILKSHNYNKTERLEDADIVLLVTCAIRDSAEQKIWNKLQTLNGIRRKKKKSVFPMKIGLLGCMAERLKDKILERGRLVDVIAGPDSYKDLPRLLSVPDSETAINVVLSFDETYADITPVRLNPDSTSGFVTIMRGCDNMCTYCIVPFTRGRERSRPIESILSEVQCLSDEGVKEVILLGQNVNSYRDLSQSDFYVPNDAESNTAKGFKTVYKKKKGGLRFSDLLDKVSLINPEMRIRFTSPHPKDFPDEVLQLIAERRNICKEIHLPAQSGNSAVLERMRRGYTRESYLDLVEHIRETLPNVFLSSDFIAGFCGETEEEFQDTLSMIELVKYNRAFLFPYSMREKTTAHRRFKDDVDKTVKLERQDRMVKLFRSEAEMLNKSQIGQLQLVLIEGVSKRSDECLQGRNDGNIRVIIPSMEVFSKKCSSATKTITKGDYVVVKITGATSQSLSGMPLYHSSIAEYASSIAL